MIVWIIFGALAGWIASVAVDNDDRHSVGSSVLVGIIGAILGGYIMSMFGYGGANGFDMNSMVVSLMGAVASLFIYRSIATQA